MTVGGRPEGAHIAYCLRELAYCQAEIGSHYKRLAQLLGFGNDQPANAHETANRVPGRAK